MNETVQKLFEEGVKRVCPHCGATLSILPELMEEWKTLGITTVWCMECEEESPL